MKLPLHAEGEGRKVLCQICINIGNLSQIYLGEEGEECYRCCSYIERGRYSRW